MSLRPVFELSAQFWTGPRWTQALLVTAGAFAFSLADVGMQVLINQWNRTFYDALEQRSYPRLEAAAWQFGALVLGATFVVMAATACKILLQVYWRQQLSMDAISSWLSDRAFYRMSLLRGTDFAPEHRIAEDVRLTVEPVVDLTIGFLSAIATAVAFASVLWSAGGTLTLAGVTIPGFMVFVAIAHAGFVGFMMSVFGFGYAQKIRDRSEAEARFRYELTRLRENAEGVALLGGERSESTSIAGHLQGVVDAWTRYAATWTRMTWVTYTNGLVAPVLPLFIMAPRYLAGDVSFGTVMQIATAFGIFQAALGWFTGNFARLAEWYAAASRVAELMAVVDAAQAGSSQISLRRGDDDVLRLRKLSVSQHDGATVLAGVDLEIEAGEMVIVQGESGAGKSTLIRAIAGLWPWGSGEIILPRGDVAFLPQRCYIPNGTLRAAIVYPEPAHTADDGAILAALEATGLMYLAHVIDVERPWDKFLSGGEQQRLAFARLLLQRPALVILDEATSALDPANEARMMELFTHQLFSTTVISVAHRPSLAQFHTRVVTVRRRRGGSGLEIGDDVSTIRSRMRKALVDMGR